VNCRAIAESLLSEGPLSEEMHQRAIQALGDEGKALPGITVPQQGSPLFLHGNLAETLADAGLLDLVCARFSVRADKWSVDRLRDDLKEHEQHDALANWLSTLVGRVQRGLSIGKYQFIVTNSPPDEATDSPRSGPASACITELLQFDTKDGDIIWADDRFITSYLRRDGAPIIGIVEILDGLLAKQAIDSSTY